MTIGSISAASLSQYVLSSSNAAQMQQALQSLQNSLASGDLNGAQSAFQTVQKLNDGATAASGSTGSSSSQLSTDLAAVGSALNSGDLSTAQSAFATVQSDLKNAPSLAQANEISAASQSVQLVNALLSPLNSSTTSSLSDMTSSVLEKVYGNRGGLNVLA
jgi:ribosomal protein S20